MSRRLTPPGEVASEPAVWDVSLTGFGFGDGSRRGLGLWEQFERRCMSGAYDSEMAVVEGGDPGDVESLGHSHH